MQRFNYLGSLRHVNQKNRGKVRQQTQPGAGGFHFHPHFLGRDDAVIVS